MVTAGMLGGREVALRHVADGKLDRLSLSISNTLSIRILWLTLAVMDRSPLLFHAPELWGLFPDRHMAPT